MVADLEFFKRLYLCSLTSYSLITGLADFSFTERCYWYLQSALNPCLKATLLSVEKPDFPDFLQIPFLSSFSLRRGHRRRKHVGKRGLSPLPENVRGAEPPCNSKQENLRILPIFLFGIPTDSKGKCMEDYKDFKGPFWIPAFAQE